MLLTEKDVRYAAALARLDLSDEEVRTFQTQLASILDYMQKLNQLDTSQVKPMTQVLAEGAPIPPLRPDVLAPSLSQAEAVGGAPESEAGLFKVPSVIGRE